MRFIRVNLTINGNPTKLIRDKLPCIIIKIIILRVRRDDGAYGMRLKNINHVFVTMTRYVTKEVLFVASETIE